MNSGYLYARVYPINDKISITVPTVGDILDNEAGYYGLITSIIAAPSDFMVQLDDIGIDFSVISSFDLFLLLFEQLRTIDTSFVFGNLDLSRFSPAVNHENGNMILQDKENGIVIDKAIHDRIRRVLRKINHLEKSDKKPGNDEAKKYMIERARIKQKRAVHKPESSQLEDLIIAMVNTEQFKYGYEEVRSLTVYQFHTSVRQIVRKINYDNTMIGCYAGTINAKELSQDRLNWLT